MALVFAITLCGADKGQAQTINWGTPVSSSIVNSKGSVLDQSYVFQLGAFSGGFNPTESNVESWLTYWKVFDNSGDLPGSGYNEILGYVTSVAQMYPDGTNSSTPGGYDFSEQNAFVWVRNWDYAVPNAEWLLLRADNWVFPSKDLDGDCGCYDMPIEWSTSDLVNSNVPIWGSQGGVNGAGEHTVTGNFTQTFTFIPEPSSLMLIGVGALAMTLRRRRVNP